MGKYIDSEKLIANIKRRIELLENGTGNPEVMKRVEGVLKGYNSILSFIDSLQQEHPEVDLEKEIEWEWVHREKQEVDLIECAEMDKEEFARFARHFYSLRNAALEKAARHIYESWMGGTMDDFRRDMDELGKMLNTRK